MINTTKLEKTNKLFENIFSDIIRISCVTYKTTREGKL